MADDSDSNDETILFAGILLATADHKCRKNAHYGRNHRLRRDTRLTELDAADVPE